MTQPQTPTTQSGQLAALFAALNVTDFAAAMAALGSYTAAGNWQNDQKAIFDALGATDQAGAISAVAQLKEVKPAAAAPPDTDKAEIFSALGATDKAGALTAIAGLKTTATNHSGLLAIIGAADQNAAIVSIGTMKSAQSNHDALVKALGATDHASALTAATDMEATIGKRVKERAASAGLNEPMPKGGSSDQPGSASDQRPITARARLAASINAQVAK